MICFVKIGLKKVIFSKIMSPLLICNSTGARGQCNYIHDDFDFQNCVFFIKKNLWVWEIPNNIQGSTNKIQTAKNFHFLKKLLIIGCLLASRRSSRKCSRVSKQSEWLIFLTQEYRTTQSVMCVPDYQEWVSSSESLI